jgi:hypothetical protein
MPGNLNPANPVDVMPKHLAKAFSMDLRLEILMDVYADGHSNRNALALNTRAYFRLNMGLTATDWAALRDFFNAHQGKSFYFYNLRETVPMGSYDPTGQNTVGRYTVVFDGQWSDIYNVARTDVSVQMREVA